MKLNLLKSRHEIKNTICEYDRELVLEMEGKNRE